MVLALPRQRPTTEGLAWLSRCIAHDTDYGRFPLWLPVLGAIGIWIAIALPFDPPPLPLIAVTMALCTARWLVGRTRASALAPAILALAALSAGTAALSIQSTWFGTAVLPAETTATIEGPIIAQKGRPGGRTQLIVRVADGDLRQPWPHAVRLSVRGAERFTVGETIRTRARLFPLGGPVMPGGYDPARRLFFDRIGATGFSYGAPERIAPPGYSLGAMLDRIRSAVRDRLNAAMDPRTAGFAAAVLVGERGGLSPEDTEALRISGLGHILAISGLHMALVAGGIFAFVRGGLALIPSIALRYPIKQWAALIGLLAATVYLGLSGGSVATIRAYVMLSVALIAILTERPALTMRTVAVAAVVVMALDPISVTEPGFQMSFAAVIALVGAYEWWSAQRRAAMPQMWLRPAIVFLMGLAATSLIAGLATLPVGAFHFHRIAPLGLVANLMAMPIFSLFAMPLGVISLVLMPLGLEALPLWAMDHAVRAVLSVAHAVADQTGATGDIGAVPSVAPLLAMAGLLWAAIFTAPWRLAGLVLIVAGLALLPYGPRPDLYVAPDGATMATRATDGGLIILGRPNGFAGGMWQKADGTPGQAREGEQCDALGCVLPSRAGWVAVPRSPRALADDCAAAALVVATAIRQSCETTPALSRAEVRTHGAAAAWWDPTTGWTVQWARPNGSTRAWQVPARMKY